METPLVSVCMITYNHAPYVAEAIEGVMMQECDFPVELIIGEDCSTDHTRDVLLKYKGQYPDRIRLLLREKNIGMQRNFIETLQSCSGKYIALCEGDDYWTDPYKLQKQVDFFENNKEYIVSFHRYKIYNEITREYRDDNCSFLFQKDDSSAEIDVELFLKVWITQPLTMMFRNNILEFGNIAAKYKYFRDQHMIYHLLSKGKGCILNFYGGIYREHQGGVHGATNILSQIDIAVKVENELYINNKDVLLKRNLIRVLEWAISVRKKHNRDKELYFWIVKHFCLRKSLKKTLKYLL